MTLKILLATAGLALAAAAGSAHAATNLIVNGDFENSGIIPNEIAGFTSSGAYGPDFAATSAGGYLPEQGEFFAALGSSPDLHFLSQTFTDVAGDPLQISYYLASDGQAPNEFQTIFDGVTLADVVDVPDSSHLYDQFTFTAVATGSDTLTFGSKDAPNYLALDNVSVTSLAVSAAPEPSTWLLMLAAIGTFGTALRRRAPGKRLSTI